MFELKKLILLLLFFTGLCFPANTQSLPQLQKKAKAFTHSNIDSSLYYWQQVEQLATLQKDTSALAEAFIHLGGLYDFKEKSNLTIEYTERSLQLTKDTSTRIDLYIQLAKNTYGEDSALADSIFRISEVLALQYKDSSLISAVYGNWASNKTKQGNLHSSLDYFLKAYDFTTNDFPKSTICVNIANTFLLLENVDRAEEYIREGIKICERNNYKIRNYNPAIIYARVLMAQKKYPSAFAELDRAIKYCSEKKINLILAQAYNLYSIAAFNMNDLSKANTYSDKAMNYFDELSSNIQSQVLNHRTQILIREKKYSEALLLSRQVQIIADQANIPLHTKEALYYGAESYEQLNQPALAFEAFKKASFLNDSLFQSRQILMINHLESQHKREEQNSAIAFLDTQNELQKTKLSQQKWIIIIGGLSLALILGLSFFLFRLLSKIKDKNIIISKSLKEKDTLLREIHHRVKNNLQLVSSLLSLQSRHVDDPNALEVLNSGKSRVKSMALIHQDLYNRENLTGVGVKDYFEKLCNELISTYQVDTNRIELATDIEDLQLDVDTLVPLGLIINELLTNALKYAFPNEQKGKIQVSLREVNQQLQLHVSDNGIGIDVNEKRDSSFGYKLINTLLYQLQGTMEQKNNHGTEVFLTFSNYKIAA